MSVTAPALDQPVDAPGRLRRFLDRWRGRRVEYDLAPYLPTLAAINARENELEACSDDSLAARAQRLRDAARDGDPPDALVCDIYALVREVARRALDMRPFDVQIVAALVLRDGKLAEMQTGEGKTLVAVLPAVFHAYTGTRTHVLTCNDYLARRDATWMGPLYERLGVRVRHVEAAMRPGERRAAYDADVTYVTAKEAGFDYLRDGLCYDPSERVHRPFESAIVDEADSILIDEARIPLIIAGSRAPQPHNATRMAALAALLDPIVHYETDRPGRNIVLTDLGLRRVEREIGCGSLHDPVNTPWLTGITVALHAKELLRRDVDYIVRGGAIELVDEFTGRVVTDRQWPDGLQAALEAKEGLRFRREGTALGTITLQHFFALYDRLAGMTATARPEEDELVEFYGLGVVVLPTNRPCIRRDRPDRVFTHREAKHRALLAEIARLHDAGRPALVGTASVRESEELAAKLRGAGLPCEVLNAKTDELEARIIADAGALGAVTISTNMAGRGTDIRLGGADERAHDAVVALGGLSVLGTTRHESRRIDRQLRGRAGRQGDPGTSRFFISLDDEMIVRYGVDDVIPARRRARQSDPVDDPAVRFRIDWCQRLIEGQNFDLRRTLRGYSMLVEEQRRVVRALRDGLLTGAEPADRWARGDAAKHARFVDLVGADRAAWIEQQVSLQCLDRLWADHLAAIADLREGIHLMRLGSRDPLTEFAREAHRLFSALRARLDDDIAGVFGEIDLGQGPPDPARFGIRGPSSTWTYLIDDNPFRETLELHVGGSIALSIAAAFLAPLYLGGALYRHLFKRRRS